jgi:hypothetical protein
MGEAEADAEILESEGREFWKGAERNDLVVSECPGITLES